MWFVEAIQTIPRIFSRDIDPIRGDYRTFSLHVGGIELCNDLHYIGGNDPSIQLFICDCGMVGCSSGNWVCLRSLGDDVAWVPDFNDFECASDTFVPNPYARTPPAYMWDCGVPLISGAAWKSLRALSPLIMSAESIPRMTLGEAIRIMQMEAPELMLGQTIHSPCLNTKKILAVTDGELMQEVELLRDFIHENQNSQLPVVPFDGESMPVEFHLDAPGFPAWSPISRISMGVVINLKNVPAVRADVTLH